jgi:fumarylacetoacetate (FAA) hydrolase family protein
MIIESIIGALVPIGAEAVKQAAAKWFGGVRATTIDEQIKLDQNEIERIKAIAALDQPIGTPSQWVVDLRASARYIGALTVIAVGISTMYVTGVPAQVQVIALEAANIAFGFLFGTRIVSSWNNK